MRTRTTGKKLALSAMALMALLAPGSRATAAPAVPAWHLNAIPLPSNLVPDTSGLPSGAPSYRLAVTNVGGAVTSEPVTLTATFPTGLTPVGVQGDDYDNNSPDPACVVAAPTVTCTSPGPVYPGHWVGAKVGIEVSSSLVAGEMPEVELVASGGGSGAASTAGTFPVRIDTAPAPFGFLAGPAGLNTHLTGGDGQSAFLAGSHPDQFTTSLVFPVKDQAESEAPTSVEKLRSLRTDLAPGLLANPNATRERCTEVDFLNVDETTGSNTCPEDAQVGTVTAMSIETGSTMPISDLYNVVPAWGAPAELSFDALNVGIFVHLDGSVRSDGDFGVSARTDDIIARPNNPVLGAVAQLWGDTTSSSHDGARGICRAATEAAPCSAEIPSETPFLTLPSACSGPLPMTVGVTSWEQPDVEVERTEVNTDLNGTPVGVSGCSALKFKPTLTLQPESEEAASPTGIHVDLNVPQNPNKTERATSTVEDTTVTLPEGMAINPSAAGGLEACSSAQIGLTSGVGSSPVHFTKDRPSCPNASKVGTVEVDTPLLDHPLPGAVYVAAPYDNPFNTLLGIYVVVDSPRDGLVIKLAGRTDADPVTGQLTTSFEEAPQVPFEDFKVDFFGGPRAVLRTPSTCGTFTTASEETPWSGNGPVSKASSFQITHGANGGPCATSEGELPNSPGFEAGTATPLAAAYSPFLGRLQRDEGSQQLTGFNAVLPPGLTGKLAGVETCSDAAIAVAGSKSGQEELASPSCPAASQIGEVKVGAGAGSQPYYTTGKIYMAGPYKGAAISGVVITPAVAGPFDLGTVVVRAPGYVDPATAQISLKSDEFPHILEGIPLDLRDARIALDRPDFTLNPTSCSEKAISGEAISLLGNVAPLSQRFQVGGCSGLDYAPKLSIRLKGGTRRGAHPKLRAVLMAKPGQEANTARASVALPRSEFLENAHIQTVCTRVQFAAKECPKGSIYGHAKAITPLLDEPLTGPVYLRSSSHELPDMVADLHGPASRPIEVELDGRIDSVKGGIRSTFDLVPDQPVSKFILYMKGGNKGLIVNSRNLCKHTYRATAKFDGQNGKAHDFRPKMHATCKKAEKRNGRHGRSR